ncbi:hypothetical protein ABNX05_09995 [Lysinibacillus sp. M3]|uniref:Uncharacterized protein n=1 Tax=Lysinibacillus zambalensis TaxID=3160866 RepID=A0ABV1MR00_9BACI
MLVIENKNELVLFSGCSHHGIVNITKTITEKFPNKTINTIIVGFHLIGLPIVNTLGKPREEVISIGNTLNEKRLTVCILAIVMAQKDLTFSKPF